jgi:flagellar biosynthetic protein FliP
VVQAPVIQAPVAPTPNAPPVALPLSSAAPNTGSNTASNGVAIAGRAQTAPAPSSASVPAAKSATAQQPKGPAALVPPSVRGRRESPRTEAAKATLLSSPAAQVKGKSATVSADGARVTQPTSAMKVESAARDSNKAQADPAAVAPIAGEDAIMKMMPQMDMKIGDAKDGGLRLNGTVGIVVMMGLLTLLPTLLLMMTGFTRILIVLHFLKQAMGTQGAPPAQLLAGLALLLTGFVMAPTLTQVNRDAITPWLDGKMTQVQMMQTGVKPMREFMLRQTRQADLKTFVDLSRMPRPNTVDDVPLHVLMSAFVASELRTSFQIGFMIYLPFIIIDAVVASVLMSMGMMMLPPAMISLPFKLLLFVLVDGWTLTIQSLVQSFK